MTKHKDKPAEEEFPDEESSEEEREDEASNEGGNEEEFSMDRYFTAVDPGLIGQWKTISKAFLNSANQILRETTDTDTALGGSIDELVEKITAIENTLGSLSGKMSNLPGKLDANVQAQLDTEMEPLRNEIEGIKREVLPALERVHSRIQKVDTFIRTSTEFIATSIEFREKLSLVQSEYKSLEKRTAHLESGIEKTWNRNFGYLTIVVAAAGTILAAYAAFFKP